jgi:hypothetical protein
MSYVLCLKYRLAYFSGFYNVNTGTDYARKYNHLDKKCCFGKHQKYVKGCKN